MNQERIFTISELNELLNLTLEQSVGVVTFIGELAEVKRPASGHIYGRIQDQESQIDIVLWASTARTVSFPLTQGLAVRCRGRPNVYRKSGKLQIIVVKIEPAGEGALRKKFLELKAKLEKEGLFAPERKRPLPYLPRAIGLVTSQTGAVVHDIMVRLKDRMPQIPVYLVDVRVQGAGAAEEIAAGIKKLNDLAICDVMIVGRGGGSLEDLWAFNEEVVVRAVFASRIPVISAVGHEVDVSLTDFAADLRAPTPTAAAEMVVPRREDLLKQLREFERRLQDYERWFSPLAQAVDDLHERLGKRVQGVLEQYALRLAAAEAHLKALKPHEVLKLMGQKIEVLRGRLQRALSVDQLSELAGRVELLHTRLFSAEQRMQDRARHSLENLAQRFEATNPRRVLERGYTLIERKGVVVKSSLALVAEDRVSIRFADGTAPAVIIEQPEEA